LRYSRPIRSRLVLPLLLVAGGLLLAGCYDDEEAADGTRFRSQTGVVPVTEQRPGDPDAGYRALVNEPYVSCGIPYEAYRRVAPDADPTFSLPGREGRNAELPYAATAHVNEDGVEIVSSNCLTCHAARIGDELIVGLGNEFADFTGDPRRFALQAGSYVRGDAETAAWQHWADRIEGIAPFIQTATVGVNPAPNLTWALMAHRDPKTLAWSDEPLLEPPPREPLPISVPPWWGMQKKNAMFYTTIGRGDHARFMLLASMLCIEDIEYAVEIDSYAADIRAFITALEPPEYPFPVNVALAAEGGEIFRRECSDCHGTYGETETYPNRVYPVEKVGTDPAYATEATDGSRDRFYEWVARSPYGDTESAAPAPGYIAPPLDGVWATAPYLHNGSVPSMAALLSSPLRPTYWRHKTAPRRYDPDTLGWEHDVLEEGQSAEPEREARRLIYDTTIRGYGNGGHTYSDDLGEREREALLEYLKTL
jgi:mono/diheme cytochrome c family protein